MKTALYVVALVVFSALMLSPNLPDEYPPKLVLEQRQEIIYKEQKIKQLIQEIEYTLVIDSIQISHKNEQ
jgi:hypothetical protein